MNGMVTRSGRRASQREDELRPFIDILNAHSVRSYLEIGARHGDTFYEVMKSLPCGSRGVAVDLGGGPWGKTTSVSFLRTVVRTLKHDGYDARLILGDSTAEETILATRVKGPFDAILIDGDHRYLGVKADWEAYGPMGRIVAFHDIAGEGETSKDRAAMPVEVPRLWHEIKGGYEHIELIGAQRGMGIGVLIRK